MKDLYKRFFGRRLIPCVDADGTALSNSLPHGATLRGLVNTGLEVTPIKLIHRASIHYEGRYSSVSARVLNACVDLAHVFKLADNNSLALRQDENFELAAGTSEVLAVGLAAELMMRTLPCDLREIRKITGAGKRCDFEIFTNQHKTVFESKGRSVRAHVKQAAQGLGAKKQAHSANHYYGLVSYLPRDGSSVEIHIYDPPGDEIVGIRTKEERDLIYLRHYRSLAQLSDLSVLTNFLDHEVQMRLPRTDQRMYLPPSRKREHERLNILGPSEFVTGERRVVFHSLAPPISTIERVRSKDDKFIKSIGGKEEGIPERLKIDEREVAKINKSREKKRGLKHPAHMKAPPELKFGMHREVVERLWDLDFDGIEKLKIDAFEDEEMLVSVEPDGSLMGIRSN